MKAHIQQKQNAFTIIETLVTLLAITLMIAAPLTFMYRSYHYAEFIKDKMVAGGLAQEGIELATSMRNKDVNLFTTAADNCANSGSCFIDWDGNSDSPTLATCSTESCRLYKSSTDASILYRGSGIGDTPTDYYRYLTFKKSGSDGYFVESVAYTIIDGVRVESRLDKMIFNIKTVTSSTTLP